MPVDQPKAGESEEQYLKYCIPAEIEAGYDVEQATAICYTTYRTANKLTAQQKIASKFREIQYRGINLFGEGDDPCWEDHEQIGTKTLDGKEVPNCVPIK